MYLELQKINLFFQIVASVIYFHLNKKNGVTIVYVTVA